MDYSVALMFTINPKGKSPGPFRVKVHSYTSGTSCIDLKATVIAHKYVDNICREITIACSTILQMLTMPH